MTPRPPASPDLEFSRAAHLELVAWLELPDIRYWLELATFGPFNSRISRVLDLLDIAEGR